jgi:hypothetical protein
MPALTISTFAYALKNASRSSFTCSIWRRAKTVRRALVDIQSLIENTQLSKADHPMLGVPGSNDFPIFHFVDIDYLNVHLAIL